jgi:hypothetical protein
MAACRASGVPRQFIAICEKRRRSILFHLLVPGGKVTDGDSEPSPIGEPLQFPLPQPDAGIVAAVRISRDHQRAGVGVRVAAHLAPPPANRIDGEAGGIVINPDADAVFVAAQIVDAVGNRLAVPGIANDEIMDADAVGFPCPPPGAAVILEIPHQLFLLRIHGDGRLAAPLRAGHRLGEIPKLSIALLLVGATYDGRGESAEK